MDVVALARMAIEKRDLVGIDSPVLLMVSGGSDSTALAYIASELHEEGLLGPLAIVHVNHKLRGSDADEDAEFVAKLAELLQIELVTKAFEQVSSGSVTFAARDSELDGQRIHKNDVLALENGKLAFTEKDINKAAYKLTKKMVKGDSSFITLIYGADVTEEKAQQLYEQLSAKFGSRLEITLLRGGQPVYYYLISVE